MHHHSTPQGMVWSIHDEYPSAAVGILPQFLSPTDPRPAREQLHEAYAHGGGWSPFQGFALTGSSPAEWCLEYPDDQPMCLIGFTELGDERIAMFEGSWVAIVQPLGDYEIARMD